MSLGTSGVLFARHSRVLAERGQRRAHVLPRAAGRLAPDGRDPVGHGLAELARDAAEHDAGRAARPRSAERLAPPGAVTFLPYLGGERTPHNDAAVRGLFAGLGHQSDRTALGAGRPRRAWRSRSATAATRCAPRAPRSSGLAAVGGGTRSRYWLEVLATALNVPVDVPVAGDFGAAFGAARLGMIAAAGAEPARVCTRAGGRGNRRAQCGALPRRTRPRSRVTARSIPRSAARVERNSGTLRGRVFERSTRDDHRLLRRRRQDRIRRPGESRTRSPSGYYDPDRVVLGKRLEEHLRFAVCYWHTLRLAGRRSVRRPDVRAAVVRRRRRPTRGSRPTSRSSCSRCSACRSSASTTRDVRPGGRDASPRTRRTSSADRSTIFERKQADSGVKLLWGTANLFSHRRYMAGAATNPDPDVFAYAAATGEERASTRRTGSAARTTCSGAAARATRRCSTPIMKRELDQLGRFLSLVVDHKHKIGFKGTILIEPKPQEPTKHQYDFDVATVYGFLNATASSARSRSTSSTTTRCSPAIPSSTRSRSRTRSASSARST